MISMRWIIKFITTKYQVAGKEALFLAIIAWESDLRYGGHIEAEFITLIL